MRELSDIDLAIAAEGERGSLQVGLLGEQEDQAAGLARAG